MEKNSNPDLYCHYSGLPSVWAYAEEPVGKPQLSRLDIDRIIEMAWEDRTPFEAIRFQFGLNEKDVIEMMRKNMKLSSFRMWRKRMKGKTTKHLAKRMEGMKRFKCSMQRSISLNKIAKRK